MLVFLIYMAPTSQAATNTDVQNAYNQGQQLQNMYNTQSQAAQGKYDTSYNSANNAQGELQNFTHNMVNGGQMYGQNLQGAQQMYGFNPQDLLKANQNLATTQTTLANLPQAIQQQGNYYGTTAGQEAGNYANMAGNINTVLAGQGNAVNAYRDVLNATQQQANQQTTQGLAGQQQQLTGYTVGAQNATAIMQQAQLAMNNVETLAQQQGGATASQVAAYQNAYNQYISAQAAAQTAASTTALNNSQIGINQQKLLQDQYSYKLAQDQQAQKQQQDAQAAQQQAQQAAPHPYSPATGTSGGFGQDISNFGHVLFNSFAHPSQYGAGT